MVFFKVSSFLVVAVLLFSSCESYPHDPDHSLQNAKEDKLRVGIMHAPPWVILDDSPKGIEVDIIRGFAGRLGTEVEWVKGTEEDLMTLLQEKELHIVIGGIVKSTPWKKHVGLTNAYKKSSIFIYNTTGAPVPEEIEDRKVAVKRGSAIGAYVKKKGGIPVYVDRLKEYKGIVAVPEENLKGFKGSKSSLSIKTDHHVLAVPKGENRLLMELEEYINEKGY